MKIYKTMKLNNYAGTKLVWKTYSEIESSSKAIEIIEGKGDWQLLRSNIESWKLQRQVLTDVLQPEAYRLKLTIPPETKYIIEWLWQ